MTGHFGNKGNVPFQRNSHYGIWCYLIVLLTLNNCIWGTAELLEETFENRTVDEIITPSDICKEIVVRFASAISNFTLCSVTNARPIHLCQWCVNKYLIVGQTHHDFTATIDDKGNPCQGYFTNLDRIEIVSEAYKYVHNLWSKGKCDYCFEKSENGSLIPSATDDTVKFELFYELTKSCLDLGGNDTCQRCKTQYSELNNFFIKIGEEDGENICLDIVDTMNTTREIWSGTFNCIPERVVDRWLNAAMAFIAIAIPLFFYIMAAILSNKQEARVLHQRRLAEVFAVTSQSDRGLSEEQASVSGYSISVFPPANENCPSPPPGHSLSGSGSPIAKSRVD